MSDLTVHGAFEPYVVTALSTDKYGVTTATAVVEKASTASFDPVSLLSIAKGPLFTTIPCTSVRAGLQSGKWVFEYGYEGVFTTSNNELTNVYEIEVNSVTEDIRTHPDFTTLEKIYGKYDNDLGFPKFAPAGAADGVPSGVDSDGKKKSALYGVTGYLNHQIVWRKTSLNKTLPASVYKALNTIDTPDKPGSGGPSLPSIPAGSNWMKTDVRAQWRGNIWQITEEWTCSGRFGWNKNMYRKL